MTMSQDTPAELKELTSQIQQCRQSMITLQNLATARNVLLDERDNWNAPNGTSTTVAQRIWTDFGRKIGEIEAEYTKILTELVEYLNQITTSLPQITRRVLVGPFTMWRTGQKMGQIGVQEQYEVRHNAEEYLRDITSNVYMLRDILTEIQSLALTDETLNWIQCKCNEYRSCLLYLMQKCFVVSKQPPMLVKDWTLRMDLSVKIMADIPTYGGNNNLRKSPVHCCMITERQAELLRQEKGEIDFSQAPINAWSFGNLSCGLRQRDVAKESCVQAQWNNVTGEAEFTAVRTKIDNRKTNESKDKAARVENQDEKKMDKMTEKKLYFLFFCQVHIDESPHWIWTLSLPFVVAVQTMQEWHLLGVIFWDTAFSELDAIPCNGKEEVTWGKLKFVLKWLFYKEVQAEASDCPTAARELTDEELNHLGTRIFGHGHPFNDNSTVHRSDVISKRLADSVGKRGHYDQQKGFTFWQWFYGCMDLLQDRAGRILRYHNGKTRKRSSDEKRTMATLFNEGIIRGFISRETTVSLLKSCPQTNIMLIRFSDNHCRHDDPNSTPAAYISITCKAVKDGRDIIASIKPLNREVLSRLTLPFVVAHCDYLNNVEYIYVGENRWVDKKRLTVNYIPILSEYSHYEGYEKLLLNFDSRGQSEDSSSTVSPQLSSTSLSPFQSCTPSSTLPMFFETSPASFSHPETEISPPIGTAPTTIPASFLQGAFENSHAVIEEGTVVSGQLMELLSEAPNRSGVIPSKYDDVLAYLISDTDSSVSSNVCTEFQPEDDADLCRTVNFRS